MRQLKGLLGSAVLAALVVFLFGLSTARDRRSETSPGALAKPAQLWFRVCDVGNTAVRIDYTHGMGDWTYTYPSFEYPTGSNNHYLWSGGWGQQGKKFGVISGGGPHYVTYQDSLGWTSTAFDPKAVSALDTYSHWAQWDSIGTATGTIAIEVKKKTYAWSEPYRDDFVVWDWTYRNNDINHEPITDFYLTCFMDNDISSAGQTQFWIDDLVDFYGDDPAELIEGTTVADSIYIGYMYDGDHPGVPGDDTGGYFVPKESPGFLGIITLSCPQPSDGHVNANMPGTHTWWDWNSDPSGTDDYFSRVAYGALNPTAPYRPRPSSPFDFRILDCWGPYDLAYNDSIRVIVALGLGNGLEGMVWNLKAAKDLYKNNWIGYNAPPSPSLVVEVGHQVVHLNWGEEPETQTRDAVTGENDFEGYKLMKSLDNVVWTTLVECDKIDEVGPNTGLIHEFTDYAVSDGYNYFYSVISFDKGIPEIGLEPLVGSLSANKTRVMPGPLPQNDLEKVYVAPNPYRAWARWNYTPYSRSASEHRLGWFNVPAKCTIRIYTLAGDLVGEFTHDETDRPEAEQSGVAYWDSISRSMITIVSGPYIYHLEAPGLGEKIGKFVVIR